MKDLKKCGLDSKCDPNSEVKRFVRIQIQNAEFSKGFVQIFKYLIFSKDLSYFYESWGVLKKYSKWVDPTFWDSPIQICHPESLDLTRTMITNPTFLIRKPGFMNPISF